jgi:hypothetical protein
MMKHQCSTGVSLRCGHTRYGAPMSFSNVTAATISHLLIRFLQECGAHGPIVCDLGVKKRWKGCSTQTTAKRKDKRWDEHDISSGQTHEMMPLKEEMMRIAKHD